MWTYQAQLGINPFIEIIDTTERLTKLAGELMHAKEISFDTEYDSFKREYGFKLLLLQIFDGKKVYLIDPLSMPDLNPLAPVFANNQVCKILYSGSEDISMLRRINISVENIFDVQIAATLCNKSARNLSDLIATELDVQLDKTQQTSDWRVRPLSDDQVLYAANDVIHLIELKQLLIGPVGERNLMNVLEEENLALELIPEREHVPKLKPSYYKTFPQAYCDSLLALMELRDKIAQKFNMPPVRVVDTRFLEEALMSKENFLKTGAFKSFHPRIRNSAKLQSEFIEIIEKYDPTNLAKKPREPYSADTTTSRPLSKDEQQIIIQEQYEPVKQQILERFGELTSEYLLRGLKKELVTTYSTKKEFRKYQQELLDMMKEGKPVVW